MTQPTAPPARVVVTYRPYRDENGAQHNHATASPALVSSCRPVPRCVLRACCVRCTPCNVAGPRSSAPRLARRARRLGARDGADRLRALRAVLDLHVPLLHQQLAQPVLPGACPARGAGGVTAGHTPKTQRALRRRRSWASAAWAPWCASWTRTARRGAATWPCSSWTPLFASPALVSPLPLSRTLCASARAHARPCPRRDGAGAARTARHVRRRRR